MEKTVLTSSDVLSIVKKIWKDSDIEVEVMFDKKTKISCVEYLNTTFYIYKKWIKKEGTYALIRVLNEEAINNSSFDYSEKTINIEFIIPEEKVEVLDHYIQTIRTRYLGKLQAFSSKATPNLKGYFTFSPLKYDSPPEITTLGRTILCSLEFKLSYTTNIAFSGDKIWLLNGHVLPYLQESIEVDISGVTNNVYGCKSTQSVPSSKTRYYRFTLPFEYTGAGFSLQKDMLGDELPTLPTTYTLSYYDNITYLQTNPFTAKVVLFRAVKHTATATKPSEFEIVFAETDDNTKYKVKYEMALIDNPFDSGTVNTRWFKNREEQQSWFNERIAVGAPYRPIKAPNLNSLTITQQTYYAYSTSALDDLLTKNYAIIKATENDVTKYYYYFIQSSNAGFDNQIIVDLKMDSIQTYYFDPNIKIAPCTINRAHLNRWKKDKNGGILLFDNEKNSKLHKIEPLPQNATYLESREPVKYDYITINSVEINNEANDFINENILGWAYIYGDNGHIWKFDGYSHSVKSFAISGLYIKMAVMVCPIMKPNKKIQVKFSDGVTETMRTWSFNEFYGSLIDENIGNEFVYDIVVSQRAPFFVGAYYSTISSVDSNALTIDLTSSGSVNGAELFNLTFFGSKNNACGAFVNSFNMESKLTTNHIVSQVYPLKSYNTLIKDKFGFYLSDIINETRPPNKEYEPKLLTMPFSLLRITDGSTNYFDYEPFKMGSDSALRYDEPLLPGMQKAYVRIEGRNNSLYSIGSTNSMLGLIVNKDAGIPITRESYGQWVANNKNAQLTGLAIPAANNMINAGIGISAANALFASGSMSAPGALGVAGATVNAISTVANYYANIDNLKNAPSSYKAGGHNVIFETLFQPLRTYIEKYKLIPKEEDEVFDFLFKFGYTFNETANVKDYDNIRVRHNYIQAEIENIDGISLSNDARNDIRQRFSAGIRFWNKDEVSYDLENYENWLIE